MLSIILRIVRYALLGVASLLLAILSFVLFGIGGAWLAGLLAVVLPMLLPVAVGSDGDWMAWCVAGGAMLGGGWGLAQFGRLWVAWAQESRDVVLRRFGDGLDELGRAVRAPH